MKKTVSLSFFPAPKDLITSYWRRAFRILIAVGIGKAISFIWKIFLAQQGPQTLGVVEIAMTVFFTLQTFSLLGLHTALIRNVVLASEENNIHKAHQYFYLVMRITLTLSIFIVFVFFAFPSLLTYIFTDASDLITIIVSYIWVVPLLTVSELIWSYWAASGFITRYGFGKYILPPLCRVISLIVLTIYGASTRSVISHIVVASSIVFIASIALSKGILRFTSTRLLKHQINQFLKFALPMSGSFLLYGIYGATDVLVVGRFLGIIQVGLLSIAILLVDIPDMVVSPMLNIFQVHLGTFRTWPRRGLIFTLNNAAIFLIIGILTSVTIYLALPIIVPMILGREYLPIINLVSWLLVSKVVEGAIILPLRHTLDFYGFTKITFFLMMLGFVTKVTTGIIFVPELGLPGVIVMQWAGVGTHAIGALLASWFYLTRARKTAISK